MNLQGIWQYSVRAGIFAVGAGVIFSLFWWQKQRKKAVPCDKKRYYLWLIIVCYLAALVQITVLRSWQALPAHLFGPHTLQTVHLVPLATMRTAWYGGAWQVVYQVGGNIAWFVPMGILLPCTGGRFKRFGTLLLTAAGFSFAIEVLQWVLGTGITDIDDWLLNTLGGMLGWCLWHVVKNGVLCHRKNV